MQALFSGQVAAEERAAIRLDISYMFFLEAFPYKLICQGLEIVQ